MSATQRNKSFSSYHREKVEKTGFFCSKTLLEGHPLSMYASIKCVCVSGGKKCKFFGNFCVRTLWMTPYSHDHVI